MRVTNLQLNNFRNYEVLNITFSKDFNIIYGDNAQGKTNIIEALFLCATGRSHRTSKDLEIIKIGTSAYSIKLDIDKKLSNTKIFMYYSKNEKRSIKINEIPVKKLGNLMGNLNAVIFSPEDLQIVKEGPSHRRRFLDMTISQLRPSYFYDLQKYYKILTQRNNLLKEIMKKASLVDTLEVWDESLADTGASIISTRAKFILEIDKYASQRHEKLSNGTEKLIVEYEPSVRLNDALLDRNIIKESFIQELGKQRKRELLKATTLVGPQRDDYAVKINGNDSRIFASQGQQRSAVLSLKLSEIDIMYNETGEYPILLLDDVMSELDNSRQKYLLECLENVQTFVTSTDNRIYANIMHDDVSYFNVINGEVSKV